MPFVLEGWVLTNELCGQFKGGFVRVLWIAVFIFLSSNLVLASEVGDFEVERDGEVYTCTPKDLTSDDPQAASKCTSDLKHRFTDELVFKICKGAKNSSPAQCAKDLKHKYTDENVASICSNASNEFPALCSEDLKHRFTDDLVVRICRNAKSNQNQECAKDQKHRILDEMIADLCSSKSRRQR
jgi:hypothetical protein